MGCFLACFGSSKRCTNHNRKLQKNADSCKPEKPCVSTVQDHSSKTVLIHTPQQQLQEKSEESLSVSTRKKVTFDSNVKTYEPVLKDEVGGLRESEEDGKVEALVKQSQTKSSSSEDSSVTSTGSYPPNHRYQNCRDSDDEDEEELGDYDGASDLSDEEDDDDDDDGDELGGDFEEDGMACSKATIDVDHVFAEEVESPILAFESDVKSIGFNPNARDRSVYVHPVLNPVENLSQWKVVKGKRNPTLRPQKENFVSSNHDSETGTSKKLNQEISVDASLSNWLVSPETTTTPVNKAGWGSEASYTRTPDRSTSQGSNSMISHEDRPILGALTLEEIKQFSATSSPRKSPSRSPDDMPIIGSVGTYWNSTGSAEDSGSATSSFKGIPNTTSKYKEDKRVNWHSTPFETRLEKALNKGPAEAASTYGPHVF